MFIDLTGNRVTAYLGDNTYKKELNRAENEEDSLDTYRLEWVESKFGNVWLSESKGSTLGGSVRHVDTFKEVLEDESLGNVLGVSVILKDAYGNYIIKSGLREDEEANCHYLEVDYIPVSTKPLDSSDRRRELKDNPISEEARVLSKKVVTKGNVGVEIRGIYLDEGRVQPMAITTVNYEGNFRDLEGVSDEIVLTENELRLVLHGDTLMPDSMRFNITHLVG